MIQRGRHASRSRSANNNSRNTRSAQSKSRSLTGGRGGRKRSHSGLKNRRQGVGNAGDTRGGSSTTPKRGGRKQVSCGGSQRDISRDQVSTVQTSIVTPKIFTHNKIVAPESKKSATSIQNVTIPQSQGTSSTKNLAISSGRLVKCSVGARSSHSNTSQPPQYARATAASRSRSRSNQRRRYS